MILTPGATLGHFRIIKPLGTGGMGAVYLAEDLQTGRRLALKVLLSNDDPVAARRLLREAQVASALDHPNIATVFAVGETDNFRTSQWRIVRANRCASASSDAPSRSPRQS